MLVSDVPVSYFGIFHEKISCCLVDIENFRRLGVHPPLIDEGRKSKNLQWIFWGYILQNPLVRIYVLVLDLVVRKQVSNRAMDKKNSNQKLNPIP